MLHSFECLAGHVVALYLLFFAVVGEEVGSFVSCAVALAEWEVPVSVHESKAWYPACDQVCEASGDVHVVDVDP